MTNEEMEARFSSINSRSPEMPDEEDARAIEAAKTEEDAVSLADFQQELEQYSGKIVLRIPRSLHKRLKDAAAMEGVSLNQYMLYKLAQ